VHLLLSYLFDRHSLAGASRAALRGGANARRRAELKAEMVAKMVLRFDIPPDLASWLRGYLEKRT
jgi:hypothetical protein